LRIRILFFVFAVLLFQLTFAYADNRNSVFFAAGVAKPEGIDATLYLTGGGRWEFKQGWAIDPMIGYWRADSVERQCPSPNCAVYDLRDVSAGASLVYVGPWRKIDLYVGGGAAAHFRKRYANLPAGSNKSAPEPSATRLGLQYVSGVDIPFTSSLGFTVGWRGDWIFRPDPLDTQFVFSIDGGLRFYFP